MALQLPLSPGAEAGEGEMLLNAEEKGGIAKKGGVLTCFGDLKKSPAPASIKWSKVGWGRVCNHSTIPLLDLPLPLLQCLRMEFRVLTLGRHL